MYTLITFPRSGAHFFQNYLRQATGYEIPKSHTPSADLNVVTIARDPIDSIASFSAMLIEYNGHSVEETVLKLIENYEAFYKFFVHHAELVIDYNELITRPDLSVAKFSQKSQLEYQAIDYIDNLSDMVEKRHIKTSKDRKSYKESVSMLKEMENDLQTCYERYSQLLKKSIS